MSHIAYYRVSTLDQSIQAQRAALSLNVALDKEFHDAGVSGAVPAKSRPGFSALREYVREGDTLHVYSVDRLGRDAIDVQATIRDLIDSGVQVDIQGLGTIAKGVGELIIAVLAQVADMERLRIIERTSTGRELAKATLQATGKTHRGKDSLGRPPKGDAALIRAWKKENGATIRATSLHFGVSESTAKRYCGVQRS
jgi:putative DNA-invertase from lambdoid prophage Rac